MSEKEIRESTPLPEKGAQASMGGGDIVPFRRPADVIPFKRRKKLPAGILELPPDPVDESAALARVIETTQRVGDLQSVSFVTISDAIASDREAFEALVALRDPRIEGNSKEQAALLNRVRSALARATKDVHAMLPWKKSQKNEIAYEKDVVSIKSEQGKTKDIDYVKHAYYELRKKIERIEDPDEYAREWNALNDEERRGVAALQDNVQLHYDYRLLLRLCDLSSVRVSEKQKKSDTERERKKKKYEEKKQAFLQHPYALEFPGEGCLHLEGVNGKHGKQLWKVVDVLGSSPKLVHEVSITLHSGNAYLEDLSNAPQWLRDAAKKKGLI